MKATTKYLLVHDTSVALLDENCEHLGFPLGTTFEQMRLGGAPYNGYFKKKDGQDVWVLPFFEDGGIVFEDNPTVYEVISASGLKAYGFDEEDTPEL